MPSRPDRLRLKRVYDAPHRDDGFRVLVDRLWPRGVSKEAAKIDLWAKPLAPSEALRKSVHAEPGYPEDDHAWRQFVDAYRAEFKAAAATPEGAALIEEIMSARKAGAVTLVFALRNEARNNAAALAALLQETSTA